MGFKHKEAMEALCMTENKSVFDAVEVTVSTHVSLVLHCVARYVLAFCGVCGTTPTA